jgi:hypothetical protein
LFRFAAGFLAGLAAFFVAFIGIGVAQEGLRWRNDPLHGRPSPFRLAGAEATRLGAASVEVGLGDRRVREDCRGGCDDLITRGVVESLRLTDAGGGCVFCRASDVWSGRRVTGGPLEPRREP